MTSKERLIELLKLLYSKTDDEHPLSTAEILAYFMEQGVRTDRDTVKADIEALNNCGIEIYTIKSTQNKYYFSDRPFELAELKLLVDAVEASKFITTKKSKALVQKLMTLAGENRASELVRHLYTTGRIKPENETIFYTVDAIHKAINAAKQISFVYCEYDRNKKLIPKRNGEPYIFSPYAMLYSEDKYYVLGYSLRHEKIVKYRVDRMKTPIILDTDIVPRPADFDPVDYTVNIFSMYDGTTCQVELLCENRLMNYVVDRFGDDVHTEFAVDDHFVATVEVSVSQTFLARIFQFAGGIKIIGPTEVVAEYQKMLQEALQ